MKNLARFNIPFFFCLYGFSFVLASYASAEAVDTNQRMLNSAAIAVRTENYAEALRLYNFLAVNGNAESQYQLANLYNLGRGVGVDKDRAKTLFEKAAAQNYPAAQYQLALMIKSEKPDEANLLIEKAAAAGYSSAARYLKRMGNMTGSDQSLTALEQWFYAIRKGQVNDLAKLLNAVPSIDAVDEHGRSGLLFATQEGNTKSLVWLITHGANVNLADKFGNSAIFSAIDKGEKNIFTQLLKAGANVNATLPNGDSILHAAVRRGRYDWLGQIVNMPVINSTNNEGWTALDLAEFADAKDAVSLLKSHNAKHGEGWQTKALPEQRINLMVEQWNDQGEINLDLLASIVASGNVALLNKILASGKHWVAETLKDGFTLQGLAIRQGDLAVVKSLINAGSGRNQIVDGKQSAIQFAAMEGQSAIADYLLAEGADALTTNDDGLDSIEIALTHEHESLAISLLEKMQVKSRPIPYERYAYTATRFKADRFIDVIGDHLNRPYVDSNGRSAFWFAANLSDANLLYKLLRYYQPDLKENALADSDGKTPFLMAAERSCLTCLKQLQPVSVIDAQTSSGNTALLISVLNTDFEAVRWLLSVGVDVDARNELGDTALIVAIKNDAADIAELLVKAGASPTRKNKAGRSARDIAKHKSPELRQIVR